MNKSEWIIIDERQSNNRSANSSKINSESSSSDEDEVDNDGDNSDNNNYKEMLKDLKINIDNQVTEYFDDLFGLEEGLRTPPIYEKEPFDRVYLYDIENILLGNSDLNFEIEEETSKNNFFDNLKGCIRRVSNRKRILYLGTTFLMIASSWYMYQSGNNFTTRFITNPYYFI